MAEYQGSDRRQEKGLQEKSGQIPLGQEQRPDEQREGAGHSLRKSAGIRSRLQVNSPRPRAQGMVVENVKWIPLRQERTPPKDRRQDQEQ